MTLKTRRILFYAFAILFIVASSAIVLYAGGYRFDFQNQLFSETGGIYIRSRPSGAGITMDGEPVENRSGIFQSGTLITNLPPGTYALSLEEGGYHPWYKNAEVAPSEVSTFDTVVLVPTGGFEKFASSADTFYFQNDRLVTKENGVLSFDGTRIVGDNITTFTDSGTIVSYSQDTETYYLSNVFDLDSSLNLNVIFNNMKQTRLNLPGAVPIKKIVPYPYNDRKFIVLTERALYTLDTERLTIEQIAPQADDFIIAGNEVVWLGEGGMYSFNLIFQNVSPLSGLEGIATLNIREAGAAPSGATVALLADDGSLFIFERRTGTVSVISESVSSFLFSQDSNILAFTEKDGSLFVYRLRKEGLRSDPLVKLTNVSLPIAKMSWHRGNGYLFVEDGNGDLRFIEVDDSLPINNVVIAPGVTSFMYDNEFLYFDDGEAIWRVEM